MTSPRWIEHRVTAEQAGQTVEQILVGALGISRRMIQRLTRARGIQRNRQPAHLAGKVRAGDVIAARAAFEEPATLAPIPMELDVVLEDSHVLVVNKPPSVLVHPTAPNHRRTLAHGVAWHWAQQGLQARVRPVHRIDRDTSGLVLFAKSALAHGRLDAALRNGAVKREYLAIVAGELAEDAGVIDAPIGSAPGRPGLRAVRPGGDPARTRFQVQQRFGEATLLRLALETGRTHQIRVHLAHIGHPVLGDRQYGGAGGIRRQALHAARLEFPHPATGVPVACEAPLPDDMARLAAESGGAA